MMLAHGNYKSDVRFYIYYWIELQMHILKLLALAFTHLWTVVVSDSQV